MIVVGTTTGARTARSEHEARVLGALRDHGACSRSELGRLVGLSRSSLSEVTMSLLDRGAIVVFDKDAASRSGAGRPAERLALDPASGQFVGLDFQHARVDLAVADATHEVLATGRTDYDPSTPWHERLQLAFELVERVAAEHGIHYGALAWVHAGIPGPYLPPTSPLTLPEFAQRTRTAGYGVREALAGRYGVPATIDNNTRLAALAEASAGSVRDLLYIRLGEGVGGGIVQNGRLTRGSHSLAGEIGHVGIAGAPDDCRCGKRGCLETLASVPAVLRGLRASGVEPTDGRLPDAAASHPVVNELTNRVTAALVEVLAPVVMALDPGEVVIAGPVLDLLPGVLPRTRVALQEPRFLGLDLPQVRGPRVTRFEGALGALQAGFDAASARSSRSR